MTRGKVYTNLKFATSGITEEQLIEFEKITSELREIFCKESCNNEEKRKKWYKNANAIRYGVLK